MHPILAELSLFGVSRPIGGYGVAVTLGLLVTAAILGRAAERSRLDVGATIATIGYATVAGFAGAFALFALVEAVRTGDPFAVRDHGGLVFYGAVPTALLAVVLAARSFALPWLRIVDLGVPGLALGHALGRIGCFLGGCCYGAPWHGPWAALATHPLAAAAHPAVPRHPVQLYEALGLVALAAAFTLRRPDTVGDGGRALAYVAAYAALRLGIEQLRDDAVRGVFGGLSTSTLISLALLAAATVGAIRLQAGRRARAAA